MPLLLQRCNRYTYYACNDNKVTITWRSNDAHLWLWPIYRYIPSQFFLLRRCYGLQAILRHKHRIFYIHVLIFIYIFLEICSRVFYSSADLAQFIMRMSCSVAAILPSFFYYKNALFRVRLFYHTNVYCRLERILNAFWAHSFKLV